MKVVGGDNKKQRYQWEMTKFQDMITKKKENAKYFNQRTVTGNRTLKEKTNEAEKYSEFSM
uniref:Uncharacterized protein n=1 Tax=Romanomermis culicivorax TaxID=13658 RepID=A0A915JH46_ROMCU